MRYVCTSEIPKKKVKKVTFNPSVEINCFIPDNDLNKKSNVEPDGENRIENPEKDCSVNWRETFDLENLREVQSDNNTLNRLRKIILENPSNLSYAKNSCAKYRTLRKYRKYLESIYINSDNLLVRKVKVDHLVSPCDAYLVPFQLACDIARMAHMNNAHIGRDKLIKLVTPYIFHPSLNKITIDVTRTCEYCMKTKPFVSHNKPPITKIHTERPFQLVHVDLMELTQTFQQNKYVLTVIDQYTKWGAAYPLRNKTTSLVASTMDRILSGLPTIPETIISDNGKEFVGDSFQALMKNYNIQHKFITPYSPQSNGLVERFNKTLQGILTGLNAANEWDKYLPQAIITYNNTYHQEIKSTPSECFTRLASKLPIHKTDKERPFWKSNSPKFTPYPLNSLVGHKIMVRKGVANKLTPRYTGPYEVKKIHSNQKSYIIVHKRNLKEIRVHHDQLRPWYNAPAYLQKSSMFRSGLDESHEVQDTDKNDQTSRFIPGLTNFIPEFVSAPPMSLAPPMNLAPKPPVSKKNQVQSYPPWLDQINNFGSTSSLITDNIISRNHIRCHDSPNVSEFSFQGFEPGLPGNKLSRLKGISNSVGDKSTISNSTLSSSVGSTKNSISQTVTSPESSLSSTLQTAASSEFQRTTESSSMGTYSVVSDESEIVMSSPELERTPVNVPRNSPSLPDNSEPRAYLRLPRLTRNSRTVLFPDSTCESAFSKYYYI